MKKHITLFIAALVATVSVLAQIKVACIGNSITAGSYPAQLQTILGSEWEVKNFGVSGSTLLRNGDHPYYKTAAYTNAKAFNPDVIIIKLGTNDSKPQNWKHKDQYMPDYNKMIAELKALPSDPYIILCTPVPAYSKGWGINGDIIENEILPYVKSLAHDNQLKLINLFQPLSNHPEWFPDGIHPNKEGLGEMASVIAKKLRKWKKWIVKRANAEVGMMGGGIMIGTAIQSFSPFMDLR